MTSEGHGFPCPVDGRISYAGNAGEAAFLSLIRGALRAERPILGDVSVVVTRDGKQSRQHVEIKTCRAPTGGTLNQVRAIKYQPLVVYTPNRQLHWVVVPAHVVVCMVAAKHRGQHTEISFESAAIPLGGWEVPYACDSAELPSRVEAAICLAEADRYSALRAAMFALRQDLLMISARVRSSTLRVIESLDVLRAEPAEDYSRVCWGEGPEEER